MYFFESSGGSRIFKGGFHGVWGGGGGAEGVRLQSSPACAAIPECFYQAF